VERPVRIEQPLDPYVRMVAAELGCPSEGRVGENSQG
jgi:hypothetical protein